MADMDEEFARFQAELAALEEQAKPEELQTNKRAREDDQDSDTAPPASVKKKAIVTAPIVIASKPKIYSDPARPVVVRKEPHEYSTTNSYERSELTSSQGATHGGGGALSGFPMGTSGEDAAGAEASAFKKAAQLPVPRIDMLTGTLMSNEEQQMMNMQQSVYEYNPNKPVRSTNATTAAAQGSGTGSGGARDAQSGKQKKNLRMAGGDVWEDQTLADWPDNDFRLFIGDLGNEVNDEILCHAFAWYASFQRARVVRDKYSHKTKGFGFVSFSDPFDCAKALREMNGKYIGNRPVKITKSKWQDRNIEVARKKAKKKGKHLF